MTIKINRRDDTFAKLVAEAKEAPGFSYAKSRNREYKGFNDDFQAEKLLKNEEIQQAVSIYKKHIIAADVVGRQEALIDLSGRFRAPDAAEVMLELLALEKLRLETAQIYYGLRAITSEEARATAKETAAVTLLTEKAPATGTIDDQNDDNASEDTSNAEE